MAHWPRHLHEAFTLFARSAGAGKADTGYSMESARRAVMLECAVNAGSKELIASLCILAFVDIAGMYIQAELAFDVIDWM